MMICKSHRTEPKEHPEEYDQHDQHDQHGQPGQLDQLDQLDQAENQKALRMKRRLQNKNPMQDRRRLQVVERLFSFGMEKA